MNSVSKRIIAAVMVFALLFTASVQSFAAGGDLAWEALWEKEGDNGVIIFPGSNESERRFSWYSATESVPKVIISESPLLTDSRTFTGTALAAPDGDFANKVTVTGLLSGNTYYYRCISDGFESQIYSFKTAGDEFSALYMTDIHVSFDETDETALKSTAAKLNETVSEAMLRNSNISLLLSAGDQASSGFENEYKAFSSALWFKSISVATAIGNHDRKGIAYKTFKNMPNEKQDNIVSSYIGSDYWFVKGDVLFLVVDSNNGSGIDHRNFVKSAVKANPDVKWRVMMCHHDLYSGRLPHRESENQLLRMLWAPIADEFKIDLVLLGHSHYYTITNVMYNNQTVEPYAETMTNPKGTIYMVSGSINRPRNDDEIGLSENVGYAELTNDPIYNIIDFSENSIKVSSYTLGSRDAFNTYTIVKTTNDGGHSSKLPSPFNYFVRAVGTVYSFFNNINVYKSLKDKGYQVNFFECVF